jgi:N6-L-threonylcarbamoyladenine synthase
MLVLGIETSCDDTSAAIIDSEKGVISNVIANQNSVHAKYGGVVPELAGRCHIENIHAIINGAIEDAKISLSDIDLLAVTKGPGLVGSLLVGVNAAKGLAFALNKPLIGVNHLEGHLLAIYLQEEVSFPFLALIVSGGHTDLYVVKDFGDYSILGRTRDDAAGESFDKVAKMLGLGYPGGPEIQKIAKKGNPTAIKFPRPLPNKKSMDFSFSGLKTAVRTHLEKRASGKIEKFSIADIAASFQEAVTDVLVKKAISAAIDNDLDRIVVTGGVAANSNLRIKMAGVGEENGITAHFPKPVLCTDNAAMIALAGLKKYQRNPDMGNDYFELDAKANLPLTEY